MSLGGDWTSLWILLSLLYTMVQFAVSLFEPLSRAAQGGEIAFFTQQTFSKASLYVWIKPLSWTSPNIMFTSSSMSEEKKQVYWFTGEVGLGSLWSKHLHSTVFRALSCFGRTRTPDSQSPTCKGGVVCKLQELHWLVTRVAAAHRLYDLPTV